ncbi:GAF domain-containing protein, partial [Streptomyces sp. TRM76130]|nr:GAF domain-containing protein [Streptomyces sp. TRM76130]
PGFSPDGLAVFGVEGDELTLIGHRVRPEDGDSPFARMALETDYPAAEVVRTGRAVYLSSPEQYAARYPLTWPLSKSFHRQSWAFLPLTVAGRTLGAWMAAFSYPVTFTPDERSVLTTVARMMAQALSRASV